MATHNDFGKHAEELAVEYLSKNGYQILTTNYRYLKAEIDIIAEIDSTIIVVEVKARTTTAFLEPHEAVNRKKIKHIVSAADHFMQEMNRVEEVQFDIISVFPNACGSLEIQHLKNAFNSIDAN